MRPVIDVNNHEQATPYVLWIALAWVFKLLTIIILGNTWTRKWYVNLNKPPLFPPWWVFAVVWLILYPLLGITAAQVYRDQGGWFEEEAFLVVWLVQLVMTLLWAIAFRMAYLRTATVIMFVNWAPIFYLIIRAFDLGVNEAGIFMLIYVVWFAFATYLNWGLAFWKNAPQVDGRNPTDKLYPYPDLRTPADAQDFAADPTSRGRADFGYADNDSAETFPLTFRQTLPPQESYPPPPPQYPPQQEPSIQFM